MRRNRGVLIVVWIVLLIATGYLAYSPGRSDVGPWGGWRQMHGWDGDGQFSMGGSQIGYGAGPSMMGGMGPGMLGASLSMLPRWLPDLSPDQAGKIKNLQNEAVQRMRLVTQQSWDAQIRLNGLYAADERDWDAIRAASRQLWELEWKQLEAKTELEQQIHALLTTPQRQALTRMWRGYGWMGAR